MILSASAVISSYASGDCETAGLARKAAANASMPTFVQVDLVPITRIERLESPG